MSVSVTVIAICPRPPQLHASPRGRLAVDFAHSADRFKVRGIDFNLRRSLVFARDTGINDGLRLRRRVAPESTRSTHRVTSPFPGSLRPEKLHIHRPADLPDVYAGIGSGSRPYDAIFDVFPVLQPVPAELHDLRLLLARSGRLFQGNPFSVGQLRSLRGGRHGNAANKYRGDNAGD